MKHLKLTAACLLLCSCAHLSITRPDGAGGAVAYVTRTGVVFKQDGHDLWLSEGVPAEWFTEVQPGRWYISNVKHHRGDQLRNKRVNL